MLLVYQMQAKACGYHIMVKFQAVHNLVQSAVDAAFPAAQLVIRLHGDVVFDECYGFLDPETRQYPTTSNTHFDLASVSKLFTVTAFMSLVSEGRVQLDQPVCEVLTQFTGQRVIAPQPDPLGSGATIEIVPPTNALVDVSAVTFRQLLAHTSGLPAWLPLWKLARELHNNSTASTEIQRQLHMTALQTIFAYPTGSQVVYSDVGLILIGLAVSQLAQQPLDVVVRQRITQPLGLPSIGYGPIPCEQAAPTEFYLHQNKRMCGEVHDENAWALNGIAGHAGLFGNARDVAAFGESLRMSPAGATHASPLPQNILREMTTLQAQDGDVRRGIGFALWSPNLRAMSNPLNQSSFGHLGFTGTSLWVDPERELTFACLTNHIYYGREGEDTMTPFRNALSRAVVEAIDG